MTHKQGRYFGWDGFLLVSHFAPFLAPYLRQTPKLLPGSSKTQLWFLLQSRACRHKSRPSSVCKCKRGFGNTAKFAQRTTQPRYLLFLQLLDISCTLRGISSLDLSAGNKSDSCCSHDQCYIGLGMTMRFSTGQTLCTKSFYSYALQIMVYNK